MNSPRIIAIIPAHNEEKIIEQTVLDLLNQSVKIGILVVADKCTDQTIPIVRKLMKLYKFISLVETVDNKELRAGAINQGIETLEKRVKDLGVLPPDAVLIMDADTRVDRYAVENGWRTLNSDSNLAAVCSRAGVLPYDGKYLWEWILYRLQLIEYAMFDASRVETVDNIYIAHGMCTLHRWSALTEIGGIANAMLEDLATTLEYKNHGFRVTVDLRMKAWTEVPLKFGEWWKQRLRWNRGSMDILRKQGFNRVTEPYWRQHIMASISLLVYHLIPIIIIILMLSSGYLILHGYALCIFAVSLIFSTYRLKYMEKRSVFDYILRLLIFPEMIYGYLQTINLYQGYMYSFTDRKQSW